jgi:general secretion pathway protein D
MQFWRMRGWIGLWSVAAAGAVLVGCATSSRQHTEGLNEMAAGETEKGLASLAAASAAEPTNSQYRLDYLKQLFLTVTHLLAQADDALRAKQYDAAGQLYRDALKVDQGNDRALRGLQNIEMDKRHDAMLAEAEKLLAANDLAGARQLVHTVLQENGSRVDAKQLATRIADEMDKAEAVRAAQLESGSVMKKPVSLQFRDANLRMVFEALSRTTGLNVIFDRDVRNDVKTTIFVHDASVADTVDMILLQSQLEKKVLNANTLFIYPATAAKQKEYQDLKVRIFQLSNADGKTVQNTLKTVLKVADMTLDDKTNTLIVRATQETIAVAEKIVAVQDYPDSEVMLEIEVLEVSRDRVRNMGIQWPSSFGVQTPTTVNTIHDLVHIPLNQLQVLGGPFGATANFSLTDSDANVLAAPRLRTRDNQKAKILIGEKVPVITNTVTPVSTGSPVVTGSVQYLDVGIKLEVKPHVYLEGDVGIEMNLEVSSILGVVNPPANSTSSGTVAYDIGTRDVTTNLRLRDGETQILGGLIQDNETLSANKVPGLGEFPILDRLFGSNSHEDKKTEIVMSITPHILRAPALVDLRSRDVFSGTESAVRDMPLRLDPVGSVSGAPSTNQAATPTPGFVGGGGAGPAMPSTATGGPTTPLPTANPNYPRNDPRVPVPRHEVPPGVTPPPWLGNPPSQSGVEPAQGEVTPPPENTNPVPAPAPMPTPPPGAN